MLAEITRKDVLAAVARRDRRQRAWRRFGSGAYKLVVDGLELDSKAVVGAAARRVVGRELRPDEFSGGLEHSAGLLVRLGFEVRFDGELLTEAHLPRRVTLRPCSVPLRLSNLRHRPPVSARLRLCQIPKHLADLGLGARAPPRPRPSPKRLVRE